MVSRGAEGGECAWEYDAPQFVDFTKLGCSDLTNDEEYFNMDHELRNPVYKMKVINKTKTVDKSGLQILMSPGTEEKELNAKPVELINIPTSKLDPNAEFHICKTELEFKENIRETSLNLADSTYNFSKLPAPLSSKSMKSNGVFQSPSSMGKIQVVSGSKKKLGVTHSHIPAVAGSFGKTSNLEDLVSSKSSKIEMEGTTQNVHAKSTFSAVDQEVVTNNDPEPDSSKAFTLKMENTCGDRGRMMNRNCRLVDQVTSAKKRLSMSVDRGRDRLRLLSPSPPLHREGSLERKENSAQKESELPSAIPNGHGNGVCHSLAFHKMRSIVKSQTIVESQIDMVLDEKEFVRGLAENNIEVMEEERLNRTGGVPHTGVPFQLLGAQRVTLPAPFSFEERTKQMLMKKQEKIRKFLETERKARNFHAQPFPEIIYSAAQPKKMVKHASKPPTKPVPFPFQLHLPNPAPKVAIVIEPKQTFRAKPAKVLHKEPFIPHKAPQRTTAFLPPSLSTKQRAEKRAERDRQMQEKEVQTEQERLIKERQQKEEEVREVRKLRAATVHKANPIRHYKLVAVVHSTKSPTIPKSPTFSRKSDNV